MDPELMMMLGQEDDEDDFDEEEIELLGELVGAPRRRRSSARRRPRSMLRAQLRRALIPKTPGVPSPGGRQQPLGFTPMQFTATSALILELVADPDRPFKGMRLVIDVVRSASGSGGLITLRRFDIGGKNQLVSRQPVTANAFEVDATLVELALDPLTPGVPSVLEIQASAQPGTGETVDIGATLFGLSIG